MVQACIIHLIRNTFRFASRKYWDQIAHDLRPVYTAASEAEALARPLRPSSVGSASRA